MYVASCWCICITTVIPNDRFVERGCCRWGAIDIHHSRFCYDAVARGTHHAKYCNSLRIYARASLVSQTSLFFQVGGAEKEAGVREPARAVRNVCTPNQKSKSVILVVEVRCHKVQGMTEAFTDTLYSRAKTSSSVHQKASRARQQVKGHSSIPFHHSFSRQPLQYKAT